jgi:hypothetical protein
METRLGGKDDGSATCEQPPEPAAPKVFGVALHPCAHFISIGIRRRNEAEIFGEKFIFIGEFEDFGGWDAQRRTVLDWWLVVWVHLRGDGYAGLASLGQGRGKSGIAQPIDCHSVCGAV